MAEAPPIGPDDEGHDHEAHDHDAHDHGTSTSTTITTGRTTTSARSRASGPRRTRSSRARRAARSRSRSATTFTGLPYYPVDVDLVFEGLTLEPYTGDEPTTLPDPDLGRAAPAGPPGRDLHVRARTASRAG